MKKYQVTLSYSRTDTFDLYADSLIDIRSIYDSLCDVQLTMVKEYKYYNNDILPKSYDNVTVNHSTMLICSNADNDVSKFTIFDTYRLGLSSWKYFISKYLTINGKKITDVISAINIK